MGEGANGLIVYSCDEAVQGGAEVDAVEEGAGAGGESVSEGVCAAEGAGGGGGLRVDSGPRGYRLMNS